MKKQLLQKLNQEFLIEIEEVHDHQVQHLKKEEQEEDHQHLLL